MLNNILKWTALAFTLTGAVATAFKFGAVNRELMAIGSVLYLVWSVRIKELNLVLVNGGLLAIYAVGLITK